jgi:shikimate kinase
MSITDIFAAEGEAAFRARELAFLRELAGWERSIVSCGGGVVVRDESRELLKTLGTVIYLKVDAAEAISRISRPETRPLLSGATPPAQLLAERLRYYEDAADMTVDTNGRSLHQVVLAVQRNLRAAGKLAAISRGEHTERPAHTARSARTERPGRVGGKGGGNQARPPHTAHPVRPGRGNRNASGRTP